MSPDYKRLAELESELGVEIISYGLAPNVYGYCYEILQFEDLGYETEEDMRIGDVGQARNNKKLWDELDQLCDDAPSVYLGKGAYL